MAVLNLIRNGKALPPLSVALNVHSLLVPETSSRRKTGVTCPDLRLPSYYIVGGLVFCPLCEPYLRSEFGDDFDAKAPLKLLDKWQYGIRETADSQVRAPAASNQPNSRVTTPSRRGFMLDLIILQTDLLAGGGAIAGPGSPVKCWLRALDQLSCDAGQRRAFE